MNPLFYAGIIIPTVITILLFCIFIYCWFIQKARKEVLTKKFDPHGKMRDMGLSVESQTFYYQNGKDNGGYVVSPSTEQHAQNMCHHDNRVETDTGQTLCHHDNNIPASTVHMYHHDSNTTAATVQNICHHDSNIANGHVQTIYHHNIPAASVQVMYHHESQIPSAVQSMYHHESQIPSAVQSMYHHESLIPSAVETMYHHEHQIAAVPTQSLYHPNGYTPASHVSENHSVFTCSNTSAFMPSPNQEMEIMVSAHPYHGVCYGDCTSPDLNPGRGLYPHDQPPMSEDAEFYQLYHLVDVSNHLARFSQFDRRPVYSSQPGYQYGHHALPPLNYPARPGSMGNLNACQSADHCPDTSHRPDSLLSHSSSTDSQDSGFPSSVCTTHDKNAQGIRRDKRTPPAQEILNAQHLHATAAGQGPGQRSWIPTTGSGYVPGSHYRGSAQPATRSHPNSPGTSRLKFTQDLCEYSVV